MSTKGVNVYEREKLYEEVWNAPVIQVAKLYGVSNVAIKKICKSMNIPTPPNGYWAKLRHGKEVHKIPLPMHLSEHTKAVMCDRRNTCDTSIKSNYGSISFLTHDEQEAYRELLSLCTTGTDLLLNGFLCEGDIMDKIHDRCVASDAQKERAIKVIDYVIAGLVKLGGRINDDLTLDIRGEDIAFHLIERISKVSHIQSEQEKIEMIKYEKSISKGSYMNRPQIPRYDYVRNGKLVFDIHDYGGNITIVDSPNRKLEERIPEIIYKFLKLSEDRRNTHLDTLEMDLKEKEERRLSKLRKLECIKEKEKLELLLNEVKGFEIAMKIRAYASYVQRRDKENEMEEWIAWANKKADWYDPTMNIDDELLGTREYDNDLLPSKK